MRLPCRSGALAWLLPALFGFLAAAAEGVEFSHAVCEGEAVTICRVAIRREKLRLFGRDEHGQPFRRLETLARWLGGRGLRLPFAMNAGMYHGDFSPVGLFMDQGRLYQPLNTGSAPGNFFLKPNGVFVVSSAGAAVVETSQYPALAARVKVELATQSGPLLVENGRIHPRFLEGSANRLIRNGVGVASPEEALFVTTEGPVNLHALATFFRETLHCPNALFLDGTISSLYAPALHRNDFHMDLGTMIGVVEEAPGAPVR